MQQITPNEMQTALAKVKYHASEYLATELSLFLAQNSGMVRAMLLDGPPGSGKTMLAKSLARVLGVDYIYIAAHPGSSPEDFLLDANIVAILRAAAGDKSAVQDVHDVITLGFIPQLFKASQSGLVVGFVD